MAAIMMCLLLAMALAACGGNGTSAAGGTAGSTAGSEGERHRAALIMKGPISDMSWNATAHKGLLEIEKLGAEIAYQESVDLSDVGDSIRTYATEGYDIIFLATNSFEDAAMEVIRDFPDTQFVIINGSVTQDNVVSVQVSDEQQGFMMGAISAVITQSGKVGFIGGLETAPIVNGSLGFEQGVAYVDDAANANVTLTGSNDDGNKAKETATAMIDVGVDVLSPMADNASLGVLEATVGTGAYAICSGYNQEEIAPDNAVISVIKDTSVVYKAVYEMYLAGTLPTETTKMGADKGVIFLSDWHAAASTLTDAQKEQVAAVYQDLADGKITIALG